MMRDVASKAAGHLRSGQAQLAMDLLAREAGQSNPGALEMLAEMALTGEYVHRDLAISRDLFARASQAGSTTAAAVYRAFVANGTGAPRDWTRAMQLLAEAEPYDSDAAADLAVLRKMELGRAGEPLRSYASAQLSTAPNVRSFPQIFTPEECDFLIARSQPRLQASKVVDPQTGEQIPNRVRTSDTAIYPLMAESPAIHALNVRLAWASGTSVEQGEPLQVLRYRPGQEYRPHIDAIAEVDNQRILTFLVYLNDDYVGGETEFVASGLKVKGKKGDGLLFQNADPTTGLPAPTAKHAGLPVNFGEKYLASRWIRQRPIALA